MRSPFLALAAVAALAAPVVPVAGAPSDFRLPPAQTPPPVDRQGPVAPDVPASRVVPTPTPTPSAARTDTPAPAPSPSRAVEPAVRQATPAAQPTPRASDTRVRPPPTSAPSTAIPSPETPAATVGLDEPPAAGAPFATPTQAAPAAVTAPREESGPWWPWLLAALVAAGALAGGLVWRRQRVSGPIAVPQIERPRVASPVNWTSPAEPLQVTLEPLSLSLTLMNATLAYRLEIANRGAAVLTGLAIGADMIAAHASMSREEQLAGPGAGAAPVQRIERLEPGESRIVEGEFRVPFSKIVPIRQGSAALLLPLARFRVEGDGAKPVIRTFAVGQPGKSAGLEPFRLDLGPRVYPKLAQRAFA